MFDRGARWADRPTLRASHQVGADRGSKVAAEVVVTDVDRRAPKPGNNLESRSLRRDRARSFAFRVAGAALVAVAVTPSAATRSVAQTTTGNGVSGTVFRDFDADGARNANGAIEPGVGGITVITYDADNNVAARTLTAEDGTYMLAPTTPGPWRLEFSGLPSGLENGPRAGGLDGSAVRVVWKGARSEDLAVVKPGETCQAVPDLAVSCFIGGATGSPLGDEHALVRFPATAAGPFHDPNTPKPATVATHRQIGSVYGVAWQASSASLFTSAYVKRFAQLGPSGIAGIYRNTKPFLDLNAVPGAVSVGTDPRPATNDWARDPSAYPAIGKIGLGDLDIALDGRMLYTVNLAAKLLVSIPVDRAGGIAGGIRAAALDAVPAAGEIGQFSIPNPCTEGVMSWRPFGLGVQADRVLVGGTCVDSLRAKIVAFDRTTRTWSTPLLDLDLSFPRGRSGFERMWEGWPDNETKAWNRPQLMLSDIVADGDDLIVGLRDRYGDQTGHDALPTATNDNARYTGAIVGELIRACATPDHAAWVPESNGSCGARMTGGVGNNDGPGGGEYYWRDDFLNNGRIGTDNPHSNESVGSLALLPATGQVVSTLMDPFEYFTGGVATFDNSTGLRPSSYEFVAKGAPGSFGKANDLGDLEALCDEAPLEIGNTVWLDSDGDGLQGAYEPGIGGVHVDLLDTSGRVLATATTDASGKYLFTSGLGLSTDGERRHVVGLEPRVHYQLRVTGGQAPLASLVATVAGKGGAQRDSNGEADGAGVIERDLVTGLPGIGDHTHDFGFTPADPTARRKPSPPGPPTPTTSTTSLPPTTVPAKPTTPSRPPIATAPPTIPAQRPIILSSPSTTPPREIHTSSLSALLVDAVSTTTPTTAPTPTTTPPARPAARYALVTPTTHPPAITTPAAHRLRTVAVPQPNPPRAIVASHDAIRPPIGPFVPGRLAFTGTAIGRLVCLAFALVLFGGSCVVSARSSRQGERE